MLLSMYQILAAFSCIYTLLYPFQLRAEPPILRITLENEPTTLDWHSAVTETDHYILSFLMRGMMRYDGSGALICDLCSGYNVSQDKRTYTFEIKPDQKWSDGSPLTAQNFSIGFKRLLDKKGAFRAAQHFRLIYKTSAKGPLVFEVQLKEPSQRFLHLLTLAASYPVQDLKNMPTTVGTPVLGPYLLGEWEKGKRIVIEGNPSFPHSRPVYRVEFLAGKRSEHLLAFRKGRVDILTHPTTQEVLTMNAGKERLQVSPYYATRLLLLNTQRRPTTSVNLRKAILYSLDRSVLPAIIGSGELPASHLIPKGMLGHSKVPFTSYDPKKAQSERHRAIPWPKWEELYLLTTLDPVDKKIAAWISGKLAAQHLKVKVLMLPAHRYYQELEKKNFHIALHTWAFRMLDSIDLLAAFSKRSPTNPTGWHNASYERLYSQLEQEKDGSRAESIINQMTRLLETQEVIVLPLTYPSQSFLLSGRVNSFARTPFGKPDLTRIELRDK